MESSPIGPSNIERVWAHRKQKVYTHMRREAYQVGPTTVSYLLQLNCSMLVRFCNRMLIFITPKRTSPLLYELRKRP